MDINWATSVINVYRTDAFMVQIQTTPSSIYQMDLNAWRLELKDIEDSSDGMAFLRTHSHNTTVTVGGAILARVIEIINGYTVTFEDDQYRVSTVGANSNIGDVTNVNQVSVSTSNSAGLQDLNSLQAASYDGAVALDITSVFTGTTFPVGTRQYPVNNPADAHSIAAERGIRVIAIMSSMTMVSEQWSAGYIFRGDSIVTILLTLDSGAGVETAEFENMTLTGTLDGSNIIRECLIGDLEYTNGFIIRCALQGTITLGGSLQLSMLDCYSNIAGTGKIGLPAIDMGGANDLALRGYKGKLYVENCTSTVSTLDFESGEIEFTGSVVGGEFKVRGNCEVLSIPATNVKVDDQTVNKVANDTRKMSTNRAVVAPDDLSVIVYDDDNVSVHKEFTISADGRTRIPLL